ncbi:CPK11 [Symbiodinium sp. CCMP2592]|nr:CPK11 [Symbiodinium sp. CCMP2592]
MSESSQLAVSEGVWLAACPVGRVPALRAFAKAPRLKRLALLVAAHLLGDEVGGLRWLFRFLARDAWLVEESVFASALLEAGEELPKDFSMLFRCADLSGRGGAVAQVQGMSLPEVPCRYPVALWRLTLVHFMSQYSAHAHVHERARLMHLDAAALI